MFNRILELEKGEVMETNAKGRKQKNHKGRRVQEAEEII